MNRRRAVIAFVGLLGLGLVSMAFGSRTVAQPGGDAPSIELEMPRVALRGIGVDLVVKRHGEGWPERGRVLVEDAGGHPLYDQELALEEELTLEDVVPPSATGLVTVRVVGVARNRARLTVLSAWLSILPPLLAIVLAVFLREVIAALVSGCGSAPRSPTASTPSSVSCARRTPTRSARSGITTTPPS